MGRAVAQSGVAAVEVEVGVEVAGHFQAGFFERGEGRAVDPQLLDFRAFGAAGHGLFQRLALPATRQPRRNALGAGRFRLPGSDCYLADALGLERPTYISCEWRGPFKIQFFSHEQRKLRLLIVRFY